MQKKLIYLVLNLSVSIFLLSCIHKIDSKENDVSEIVNCAMIDPLLDQTYQWNLLNKTFLKNEVRIKYQSFFIRCYSIDAANQNFFNYILLEYNNNSFKYIFPVSDIFYYYYGSDDYIESNIHKNQKFDYSNVDLSSYRYEIYNKLSLAKHLNYIFSNDSAFNNFSFTDSLKVKKIDFLLSLIIDSVNTTPLIKRLRITKDNFESLLGKTKDMMNFTKKDVDSFFVERSTEKRCFLFYNCLYTFDFTINNKKKLHVDIDLIGKEKIKCFFF